MRWLKKDLRTLAIALSGMLLLLALMGWLPLTTVDAHARAPGLVSPVTIQLQATPTEDATVTALNKEKLAQEVQQLENQNSPNLFDWLRTNAAILLSTLVVVIGGLIGLFRWFGDRRSERDKRAEERFQTAVTGLGDDKEGTKIGAAILLRTFLRPGYEQFYTQTFDLAVANLCPTRTPTPQEDPLPLTTLRQALIVAFKEAFPRARSQNKGSPQSLDASYIQIDNAYLVGADLQQVWIPQAFLRKANLRHANLSRANLEGTDLREADLSEARLKDTNLSKAFLNNIKLDKANLWGADLSQANLDQADLGQANLNWATLTQTTLTQTTLILAKLIRADLSEADLKGADLSGADLSGAVLRGTNLEEALSLKDTNLRQVIGLSKEQLETFKTRGALIDEGSTASSSQAPVSSSSLSQSSDLQAHPAPPAQSRILPPDQDGSNATSSEPSL